MNTQFEKFIEPIKQINELTVKNFESIAQIQIKAAEENMKSSIDQVKNVSTVKDADSWKDYLNSQAEFTQKLGERFIDNTRNVVELGNAYNNEVQQIVKDIFAVK